MQSLVMDEMRKSENGFIEAESSVCLAQQAPQVAPQVADEQTSTLDSCVITEQTLCERRPPGGSSYRSSPRI